MHSNEQTSTKATSVVLEKHNIGSLIELQNGGKRNVTFTINKQEFTFDPNRIFNKEGIKKNFSKSNFRIS